MDAVLLSRNISKQNKAIESSEIKQSLPNKVWTKPREKNSTFEYLSLV